MKRLGRVSHYAKQGFLIVRTEWIPSLNEPVVDTELKHVGVIKDVFGPVDHPYVAVKPHVRDPEKYVGALLYVDRRKSRPGKGKRTKSPAKKAGKKRPAPRKRG